MTVKELIEQLEALPQDLPVRIGSEDCHGAKLERHNGSAWVEILDWGPGELMATLSNERAVVDLSCPGCGETSTVAKDGWSKIVCLGCRVVLVKPREPSPFENFINRAAMDCINGHTTRSPSK